MPRLQCDYSFLCQTWPQIVNSSHFVRLRNSSINQPWRSRKIRIWRYNCWLLLCWGFLQLDPQTLQTDCHPQHQLFNLFGRKQDKDDEDIQWEMEQMVGTASVICMWSQTMRYKLSLVYRGLEVVLIRLILYIFPRIRRQLISITITLPCYKTNLAALFLENN